MRKSTEGVPWLAPRVKVAKSGYYLRSLVTLAGLAQGGTLTARLLRPAGTLVLRDGLRIRIRSRIDLLVLVETLARDAYGLRELEERARTIVDVGAGIGDFTVVAARAFPRARVVAFEPDPCAFALLVANVETNGTRNVDARQTAVGTAAAYGLVHDAPFAAVTPAGAGDPGAVAGVRLDDALEGASVDLLKVDCEGAELDVLASLGRAGLARVRRIAIEYHGAARADEVSAMLDRHGFEVAVTPDRYSRELGYVRAVARGGRVRLDGPRDRL